MNKISTLSHILNKQKCYICSAWGLRGPSHKDARNIFISDNSHILEKVYALWYSTEG